MSLTSREPFVDGWTWWFGHLLVLDAALRKLPSDAHVLYAWQELFEKHPDSKVFLVDLWPVYAPMLLTWDAEASNQIAVKHNLPKPRRQFTDFAPIVGGESMISMSNETWKPLRALFNPGFSGAHMTELIPAIVESVEVFCDLLRERAHGPYFSLDGLASRLTMDVITKVTLDTNLDNQRHEHHFSKSLNTVLAWHSFWDPRILWNPLRLLVQRYYGALMDRFLRTELEKRYLELLGTTKASGRSQSTSRGKSVTALALDAYLDHQGANTSISDLPTQINQDFMRLAATQIRLFIFAGNDSTSSSIVYAYHLLHKHPEVMRRLREEHNEVFGTGSAAAQLKENPALLCQCPYTLAVIKETLRLFPPAGTVRGEHPGTAISDEHGKSYSVSELRAMITHRYIHIHPHYWMRANEFLPERWLVEPNHELYPPQNGAYRPFELGPRNCIAQALVHNELRIVLIMTARQFDIAPAYDEWDADQLAQEGKVAKLSRSLGWKSGSIKTVFGERAYQTERAGAHPADGYPCRVALVDNNSSQT